MKTLYLILHAYPTSTALLYPLSSLLLWTPLIQCFTEHTTTLFSSHSTLFPTLLILICFPLHLLAGMDCAQGALRSRFGPEMGLKITPKQSFLDDILTVNGGQSGISGGDDSFVDDLLDFSNGFSETKEEEPEIHEQKTVNDKSDAINTDSTSSVREDFGYLPCSELSVPAEDLENLEWLSHFVEDSFSEYSLTGKLPPNPPENRHEPEISVKEKPSFTPVQTKTRTKRTRTGVRIWPLGSPEPSSSSSSSTSSTSSFPAPNPYLVYASPGQSQTAESLLGNLPVKMQKTKPTEPVGGGVGAPRRCSHCGVTKTPQWRAGPLGAKTLCNACGVRYKSGRLLPEYRPACSPSFSIELHSNNHRKVLEMRQKKEVEPAPVVPRF